MNTNNSLTISIIIIIGIIVFGGSFLAASYFMETGSDRDSTEGALRATPQADSIDTSHLGKCRGERVYTSFEEAFANPDDVCSLQISDQALSRVPAEIGQLRNLTYLSILRSGVTTLPPEIGELQNLTTLYLNFNQISALPDEISGLPNLARLQLVQNPISGEERERIRSLLPSADVRF